MTLNTVPGLWNSNEGIETKSGMERACSARHDFATSRGVEISASPVALKNTGNSLG